MYTADIKYRCNKLLALWMKYRDEVLEITIYTHKAGDFGYVKFLCMQW